MPQASILAPVTLAVVLALAAVAKFRNPESLRSGAASLRLPGALTAPAVLRAVPVAELVLALGLVAGRGRLFLLAAIATTALMTAYLVIVLRPVLAGEEAACGCFGEAEATVDRWTVARNALLVAAGVAAIVLGTGGEDPLGVLGSADGAWAWLAGAALVAALVWTATRHETPRVKIADGPEGDYIRVPIPPVAVQDDRGEWLPMDRVGQGRPVLALLLNPGCGSCLAVDAYVPTWRERLPEVDIRAIFQSEADDYPAFPNLAANRLIDARRSFANAVGADGAPSAVLLGVDGLLAGGPVLGLSAVTEFVDDIEAELLAVRAALEASVEPSGEDTTEPARAEESPAVTGHG